MTTNIIDTQKLRESWDKKRFAAFRVFLGVTAGCLLLLRVAPAPEWRDWRNEHLVRAVQKGDTARAYALLELGADANLPLHIGWPLESGGEQNPHQLIQSSEQGFELPLLCYAIKHAPRSNRAALVAVLLDHGAEANAPGMSQGEISDGIAQTPLERAMQTHDGTTAFVEDKSTVLVLRAYGAK